MKKLQKESMEMTAEELIREMPKGLIKWYPFETGSRALFITDGMDTVMAEALEECGVQTDCCTVEELAEMESGSGYEYAVIAAALEKAGNAVEAERVLGKVRALLKENGKLFLGLENRLGIRYFCGDRDTYTDRSFDSIENYVRANTSGLDYIAGRSYAKAEIEEMLEKAGFINHRFYSVFPLLQRPQILFAEDYTPTEKLDIRIFPQYNYPQTVFLEEERLYDTLIQNGLFHTMANGFWIECPVDGRYANANQITMSVDRGKENAMFTIIRRDDKVEKKAIYSESNVKIKALMDNGKYLSEHGISMVDAVQEGESFVMPYIHEISALEYLRKLVLEDRELFFKRLDELWELILSSSEHVPYSEIDWERYEPYWETRKKDDPEKDKWKKLANGTKEEKESIGVILKRGYIDLVPLNCFWENGNFLFFDQELYVENLPAKVILLRTIDLIYMGNPQLYQQLPVDDIKEKYGLNECRVLFYRFVGKFLNDLRNDVILKFYHKKVRRDVGILNSNRQRMNYSADDYEKIFRDIFKGAENRSLYLFGSGKFTQQFLSQFGKAYEIAGIIDNNAEKWGTRLDDVEIYSPEILNKLEPGTFKVIVCIKNYVAVMHQLQDMGITDFSIYDSSLTYPRREKMIVQQDKEGLCEKKKYHVGYIAGVFDLFHVGHLNMFKRAKELCDYLIVGVVTDEGVIKDKRTSPFVPFEERIELVRSCKYVDEAVEIPPDRSNTDEAYRRYQFDVQFSGSDYEHDEGWLAKKEFLRKQGADMIFFPYTQSTSSTKIKDLINKKLM